MRLTHSDGRIRLSPRISAPKLGEYLGATAPRRQRILRDQKFPSDFITLRYAKAGTAIRAALLAGDPVAERLQSKARYIEALPSANKYQADSNECCAEAIRHFAHIHPDLPLQNVTVTSSHTAALAVRLNGVAISVWPTVLFTRVRRDGLEETGALLLVFRKGEPLEEHGGKAVAELLRQALEAHGRPNVVRGLCLAVDVFGRGIFKPPAHAKRLSHEMESACHEIAAVWLGLAA